ncbi:MAG: hypothetical protein AMXMBFR64_34070 [Myxococcales bacterium]
MADTKKFESRTMRKGIKRSQRRKFKAVYEALSPDQRKKFNHSEEKVGLRQFLAASK